MLKIENLETSFQDMGEGEVVLLLHGWGGTSASMLGLANDLSSKYRTVVPDLWGFGQSDLPPENYDVFSYAKSVKGLMDALKIEKFCVVGHSFGGRVAIVLASLFPKSVKSVVLLDSAGLKPKFSLKKYFRVKKYKRLKRKVLEGILPEDILKNFGSPDYKDLPAGMQQVFVNVVNQDLAGLLDDIKHQTLILWGKKDTETPPYMAKLLHKKLKCSKLLWLNGGHFAYMTEQNECLKQIYKFLEEIK